MCSTLAFHENYRVFSRNATQVLQRSKPEVSYYGELIYIDIVISLRRLQLSSALASLWISYLVRAKQTTPSIEERSLMFHKRLLVTALTEKCVS